MALTKTVRYGTETITKLGPKIWSIIIPDKIRKSTSLETFRQKNQVMETK